MAGLKVYLQYPWQFPDSPYYKYLLNYPPYGINYASFRKEKFSVISSSKKFEVLRVSKNILRKAAGLVRVPNISYSLTDADIIHCAHCLSLNRKPWVVDTEVYDRLSGAGPPGTNYWPGRAIIAKLLLRKECRKIMPWTAAAMTSITAILKEKEIGKKTEVLYPGIPLPKFKKAKKTGINLLFTARWFWAKGGLTTLKVFDLLTKKYDNVRAVFISALSQIPQKYNEMYSKNDKIKILNLIPEGDLFGKIFPTSDIFVYPGYGDSFGFAMLEAMSYGLPVITVDGFARREIVEDDRTGFVINRPKGLMTYHTMNIDKRMTSEMVDKTSLLIEDLRLRKRMGRAARLEIEKGKFSIKRRNKKLRDIYQEAAGI